MPSWISPSDGTLLHVCGEQNEGTLAGRLTALGYVVQREILYVVEPRAMPPTARDALRAGQLDAAIFFSPRSARMFMEQAEAISLHNMAALCISPATAQALPQGAFGDVRIAAKPNQDALLALLD